MPMSVEEIIASAETLAAELEDGFDDLDWEDATSLRRVFDAFQQRAAAERQLVATVRAARADGVSWALIGSMMGLSGEGARRKYGAIAGNAVTTSSRSRRRAAS